MYLLTLMRNCISVLALFHFLTLDGVQYSF